MYYTKLSLMLSFVFTVTSVSRKECQPEKSMLTINCQNYGLQEVPNFQKLITMQITKMNLSNNNIRVLHEDTFKGYTELRELVLDNNGLQTITKDALSTLKKLRLLSLRNNYIVIQPRCVSKDALKHLNNLERLDISENPLGTLKSYFFQSLHNLKYLTLERTVMGLKIEEKAFSGLKSLEGISLANNGFTGLPPFLEKEFNDMPLKEILLHGNVWKCDCKLRWLKRVINRIQRRNNHDYSSQSIKPVCDYPNPFKELELQMLKESDYQCLPEVYTKPQNIQSSQGSNISINCEFYANPKQEIQWYKDGVLIQDKWPGIVIWSTKGFYANSTLFIKEGEYGYDDGVYRCEIASFLGKSSSNFTVRIIPSMQIRRVQVNQILILVGIGSSILIILIVIIGILMYIFMGKSTVSSRRGTCGLFSNMYRDTSSNSSCLRHTAPKRRGTKSLNIETSEAVENIHFLDNFSESNNHMTSSIHSHQPIIPDLNQLNSIFNSQYQQQHHHCSGSTSKDTANPATNDYIQQILGTYSPGCPVHVNNNDPSSLPQHNNPTNICPLHGSTTPVLLQKPNTTLISASPLLFNTTLPPSMQSGSSTASTSVYHHPHSPLSPNDIIKCCTNDLNNTLLGNVGAFYSLERQCKITKPNQNQEFLNKTSND